MTVYFFRELSNLKSLIIANNNPANFCDKILRKFLHSFSTQSQQDDIVQIILINAM